VTVNSDGAFRVTVNGRRARMLVGGVVRTAELDSRRDEREEARVRATGGVAGKPNHRSQGNTHAHAQLYVKSDRIQAFRLR